MRAGICCVVFVIALFLLAPADGQVRRAGAHQHSMASAQLAVERSGQLNLMIRAPGANLVGFEHPPRNEQQRASLQRARTRLEQAGWLVLPEAAGCTSEVNLTMQGFEGSAADDQEHDHAHSHQHAEFRIDVSVSCESARAPEWIELRLFDGWPDNRVIVVDVISVSGQWQMQLDAGQPRIVLQ